MVNDTWLENVAPPTAYLNELSPNIRITVGDGSSHKCTISFGKFLKNSAKICNKFWWKPSFCNHVRRAFWALVTSNILLKRDKVGRLSSCHNSASLVCCWLSVGSNHGGQKTFCNEAILAQCVRNKPSNLLVLYCTTKLWMPSSRFLYFKADTVFCFAPQNLGFVWILNIDSKKVWKSQIFIT